MQIPSSVSTRLHYQHKSLIDIIDGLTDEQIRRQVTPGKWSIFEHMVHLKVYQDLFIHRVKLILENSEPKIPVYTADSDPDFHEACQLSSREVIQQMLTLRKEMAAGILSFPETDLVKKGIHAAYGCMNLVEWMHFFLLHEAHHLYQVFQLSASIKNPHFQL